MQSGTIVSMRSRKKIVEAGARRRNDHTVPRRTKRNVNHAGHAAEGAT